MWNLTDGTRIYEKSPTNTSYVPTNADISPDGSLIGICGYFSSGGTYHSFVHITN